jgi:hypothetical protein
MLHLSICIATIGIWLTFVGFFLGYVSKIGNTFSLSISWLNMLFCRLWGTIKFINFSLLLVATFKELGVHILAQQVVGLPLS